MSRSWQYHRQGGEASKPMEQQIKQANGGGGVGKVTTESQFDTYKLS